MAKKAEGPPGGGKPDAVLREATAIGSNVFRNGDYRAEETIADAEDAFLWQIRAKEGSTLDVRASPREGDLDLIVLLYDGKGRVVGTLDQAGEGGDEHLLYGVNQQSAGTYYVGVMALSTDFGEFRIEIDVL